MPLTWIVFLGVLAVVLGTYWVLVLNPESREQTSLRRRLKSEDPAKTRRVQLLKEVDAMSSIKLLNALLGRLDRFSSPLKETLDQGGLSITVGTVVLIALAAFLGTAVLVNAYLGMWWPGLLLGATAAYIPFWVVEFMKTRRVRQFEEQFPEAIELIARAMRAGHAFATGLKMASDEMPAPAGPEFKLLYERQNYGAQLPDALRTFADRVPSLDARFFVTAVLTQREAGGNLSEVLDRLAAVMRERFRIKREVRVRSAHGRITAFVLAGMPPVLAAFMMSGNPEQLRLLTNDPLGVRMIVGAVVLQVAGMLIVRKLVDIKY